MSVTNFTLVIFLLFVLVAGIEIYRLLHRDVVRSMLSGATVLVSILLSAILSPLVSTGIINLVYSEFGSLWGMRSMLEDMGQLATLVLVIASMVLSTVLLTLLFFAIRGCLALIVKISYGVLGARKHADASFSNEKVTWLDRNKKGINVLIGLVNGFLITVMITTPIMGSLRVAAYTFDIAESFEENCWDSPRDLAETVEGLREYANDPLGNAFYELGGKYLYFSAATAKLYGSTVYLDSELECLENIANDFSLLIPIFTNPKAAGDRHVAALERVCDELEKMELSRPLLAEYVSKAAGAWSRGNTYYSIGRPMLNEFIDPVFDEILNICMSANIYNAQQNTITLLRVYAIIIDSGLLHLTSFESNSLLSFMEASDIIERLSTELKKNPDMASIADDLSALALGAMVLKLDQLGLGADEFDELMTDFADAVETVKNIEDEKERAKAFNDYTQHFLRDHGAELPDSVTQFASEKLLDMLLSNGGTVDASGVEELLRDFAF